MWWKRVKKIIIFIVVVFLAIHLRNGYGIIGVGDINTGGLKYTGKCIEGYKIYSIQNITSNDRVISVRMWANPLHIFVNKNVTAKEFEVIDIKEWNSAELDFITDIKSEGGTFVVPAHTSYTLKIIGIGELGSNHGNARLSPVLVTYNPTAVKMEIVVIGICLLLYVLYVIKKKHGQKK